MSMHVCVVGVGGGIDAPGSGFGFHRLLGENGGKAVYSVHLVYVYKIFIFSGYFLTITL